MQVLYTLVINKLTEMLNEINNELTNQISWVNNIDGKINITKPAHGPFKLDGMIAKCY